MIKIDDRDNLIGGVILSYITLIISFLGSVFITPIILNNVGDRQYGLLAFVNSITAWLSILSTSVGTSFVFFATREVTEMGNEYKTNTIFRRIMFSLGTIIAVVVIVVTAIIRGVGFQFSNYSKTDNDSIWLLLIISGLTVATTVFFSVFDLYVDYKKAYVFEKSIKIFVMVCSYIANWILAIYTKSVVAIAIVSIVGALINGVVLSMYSIRYKSMRFEKESNWDMQMDIMPIMKYSLIVLIGSIISNLDSNLDKTLLGIFINAESVTLYQLSISFASQLMIVAYSFVSVLRPTIFMYFREGQDEKANALFSKVSRVQCLIVMFIIGGYVSCGRHFVEMWIGPNRINVFYYSVALFLSLIVPCTKTFDTEAYRAKNIHIIPTAISAISIITNLVISITLLFVMEKDNAVWACVLGTIVARIVFGWIITPIINDYKLGISIYRYYKVVLKYTIIATLAVIPASFMGRYLEFCEYKTLMVLFIEGVIFSIVYIVQLIVFEKDTIVELLDIIRRK